MQGAERLAFGNGCIGGVGVGERLAGEQIDDRVDAQIDLRQAAEAACDRLAAGNLARPDGVREAAYGE